MRRSAGMGGGSVLRAVGRAVGSGIKDSVSGTIDAVTFSSSSRSSATAIMSAATRGSSLCFCEGEEWERIEREDENVEREDQFERFVFEPVPSEQEAEEAVSTIRQVFVPIPFGEIVERSSHGQETKDTATISTKILPRSLSTESQSDWIEPAMHLYSSKNGQSHEREKVLDAFRLLQFNPSIQKIVVSLSSDRAVWDAVMKNEAVQEFKKSFYEARRKQQDPDEEDLPQPANGLLKWIVGAKVKIMEILDRIAKHFNYIFLSSGVNKHENDHFDNVIRSSLMLSVLVFIVVVICRVQRS